MRSRSVSRFLKILFITLGLSYIGVITLHRSAGVFSGLWEDEIHYNEPILGFSRVSGLRNAIAAHQKPLLSHVITKNIFSRKRGIKPSERDVHTVPLVFSALHLAAVLFVPWTASVIPRILSVTLLANSTLEFRFAAEAQYYSFVSFLSTVFFLSLLWCLEKTKENRTTKGLAGFLTAVFLMANTHFFNAPLIAAAILVLIIYFYTDPRAGEFKRRIAWMLGLGLSLIVALAYFINKPAVDFLVQMPMSPAKNPVFSITATFPYLAWNWSFINVTPLYFMIAGMLALGHPQKEKRYWAAAMLAALFIFKLAFTAVYLYKTEFPYSDRYTIMYIGPSVLLIGLGADSLLSHLRRLFFAQSRISPHAGLAASAVVVILSFLPLRFVLANFKNHWLDCPNQIRAWKNTPPNYSDNYEFFERVKSLDAPVLVMTNHCWSTDIPMFYLKGRIGRRLNEECVILDTAWCSTEQPDFLRKTESFLEAHRATGVVVYFYEKNRPGALITKLRRAPVYRQERGESSFLAVYRAQDISWPPPT